MRLKCQNVNKENVLSIADRWSTKTGDEEYHPQRALTESGAYLATVLYLSCRVSVQYFFVNYRDRKLGLCFGRFGNALSVR